MQRAYVANYTACTLQVVHVHFLHSKAISHMIFIFVVPKFYFAFGVNDTELFREFKFGFAKGLSRALGRMLK
jgi:hypothetical protein